MTAVQDGLTSILVTWTPSSGATGYRIDYSGGGSSDSETVSETVSGGDTNSHTLTGLTTGGTYFISIVAISHHFFSDSVSADRSVSLGEHSVKTGFPGIMDLFAVSVPGKPEIATVTVSTATTISLSWSVPSDSVVTEYLIEWQRDTSVGCSDENQDSTTITDTSYTISGLEEDSRYTITVTASNTAGSSEVSNSVTAVTEEAGERLSLLVVLVYGPLSLTAPSAPPSSVTVTDVTSSTISVQWGSVPCIHQNGDITGYSVQYGVQGDSNTQKLSITGASITNAMITDLNASTNYSIQVATVNSKGTGVYSETITTQTEGTMIWNGLRSDVKCNVCRTFAVGIIGVFDCNISDHIMESG